MRHSNQNRTLSRTRRGRTALLRGLAVDLFVQGKLKTTSAKAKELRPFAEKMITKAKNNTIAAKRLIASELGEPKSSVITKLFDEVAPNYKDRNGGYTRVVKMGRTPAGKDEAVIELV